MGQGKIATLMLLCFLLISITLSAKTLTELSEIAELLNRRSSIGRAEELILRDLTTIEDSKDSKNLTIERIKRYFLLSFCYPNEEDKAVEALTKVTELLASVDSESDKDDIARFFMRFSVFYESRFNFHIRDYKNYYTERKDKYIRMFDQLSQVSASLDSFYFADRIKGYLIRFRNTITDESDNYEMNRLENLLNEVIMRTRDPIQ